MKPRRKTASTRIAGAEQASKAAKNQPATASRPTGRGQPRAVLAKPKAPLEAARPTAAAKTSRGAPPDQPRTVAAKPKRPAKAVRPTAPAAKTQGTAGVRRRTVAAKPTGASKAVRSKTTARKTVVKQPPVKKAAAEKRSGAAPDRPRTAAAKPRRAVRTLRRRISLRRTTRAAQPKEAAVPVVGPAGTATKTSPPMPRQRRIPPILLEGDEMPTPLVSGPGRRFSLGPTPPSPALALGAAAERLPAAYGTRRLWLAARDPHWLYANWDLRSEEMEEREGRAVSGHLTLRIHENAVGPAPVLQIPLAKGARSWFVRVGRGGVR